MWVSAFAAGAGLRDASLALSANLRLDDPLVSAIDFPRRGAARRCRPQPAHGATPPMDGRRFIAYRLEQQRRKWLEQIGGVCGTRTRCAYRKVRRASPPTRIGSTRALSDGLAAVLQTLLPPVRSATHVGMPALLPALAAAVAPCSANAPTSFWRTSPCASSSRSSPGGDPGRGSPPRPRLLRGPLHERPRETLLGSLACGGRRRVARTRLIRPLPSPYPPRGVVRNNQRH